MSKKVKPNIFLGGMKGGEMQAFEKIYATYYEKLCVYLLSYSSNKEQVEDVVQETFIALWSQREELKIRVSLKSYLYRSAYNKLMDTFRNQQKTNSLLIDYYHTALMRAENFDEDYKDSQLKKLKDCMSKLPPKCREVFSANKISGKKYQQLATDLGLSIKTVEGHITKGYKLLKECMEA